MSRRISAVAAISGLLVLASPATALAANGWELPAISVPAAQGISKGEGVTVAVIDTGIRTAHPVLQGRATEGPDFLGETDQHESWYGRHGTSMASSVLDVAPAAKVVGLRAIRDREDPDYQDWAAQLKDPKPTAGGGLEKAIRYAADSGARVISMSLGSDSPFSPYDDGEARTIQYALSKGVVVVAAAGNEGDADNPVGYPAAYPGVITVAATNPDRSRAEFSSVHTYVDIAAPGVQINGADATTGGRKPVNGTSSATALTSGTVALFVAKYPKLAPRQIEQVLQQTASTYSKGYNPLTGYGVIDAAAALHAAAALAPEGAVLPVGKQGAGGHFGSGDDGTPIKTNVPLDPEYFVFAAILGVPGLIAVVVGILLFVSGRRAQRRALTGHPPAAR
jgi:subtilisin family serine protease